MVNGPGEIPDLKISPIQAPTAPNPVEPKAKATPQAETQAPDRVELSPRAREVQSLVSRVQSEPEVRPERVEQVRAAAPQQENSDVPAAKVAEKLLLEG